jgi:hypothetical protein
MSLCIAKHQARVPYLVRVDKGFSPDTASSATRASTLTLSATTVEPTEGVGGRSCEAFANTTAGRCT